MFTTDEYLSSMLNEELFSGRIVLPFTDGDNEANLYFSNMKSAKLLKVEQMDEFEDSVKIFKITIDLQYNRELSIGSGEQYWGCHMVYETPQTGWKILEFGH